LHRRPVRVAIAITLGSFAYYLYLRQRSPVQSYYSSFARFWEIGAGASLAFARQSWPPIRDRYRTGLSWFGAVLILLGLGGWPLWLAYGLTPLGTALLIEAGPDSWVNRRVLAQPILVYVGLFSFPLYLWHWLLFSFAVINDWGIPSVNERLVLVNVSVLLAWATYRYFEKPIQRGQRCASAIPLGLAMAVVAGMGGWLMYHGGLPERSWAKEIYRRSHVFHFYLDRLPVDLCQKVTPYPKNWCHRALPDRRPTVALIGDSHAADHFFGLAKYYESRNENLMAMAQPGCAPFFDLIESEYGAPDICREYMNSMLEVALGTSSIKTIILISRGPANVMGSGYGEIDRHQVTLSMADHPEIQGNPNVFRFAMRETLRKLVAAGKQVYYIVDVPELGFDPKSCVDFRRYGPPRAIRTPCAVTRAEYDARNRSYLAIVDEVLKEMPMVRRYEPSRYLCDQQYCWAIRDGVVLYRNDDHLTIDGSFYLAKHFAEEESRHTPAVN
jgi:hypothetical protein